MRFEWDENKSRSNLAKHGIDFAFAQRIWDDPDHLILIDIGASDEERWLAIGNVGHATILVAVHAYRGDDDGSVRIISARKATRHERARYEKEVFGR